MKDGSPSGVAETVRGTWNVRTCEEIFVAGSASSERPAPGAGKGTTPNRRYAELRSELVAEIEAEIAATAEVTGRASLDQRVLDAITAVPRHEFVPEHLKASAYGNHPLPIGEGQTISQPYIVALMTDLLEPRPDHMILEIGTGSGYQAAVLAQLAWHVDSIEVVASLAERAIEVLTHLGVRNVSVHIGDGREGWPEHAPYDGIIVTAAAPGIPNALLDQLKSNGRLAMPISRDGTQDLVVATKADDGSIRVRNVLPVAFVPFV